MEALSFGKVKLPKTSICPCTSMSPVHNEVYNHPTQHLDEVVWPLLLQIVWLSDILNEVQMMPTHTAAFMYTETLNQTLTSLWTYQIPTLSNNEIRL